MSVKEGLNELSQNPKVASVVSTLTTTTGMGTIFDWIPNDIGKLATLIGILLSLILIYSHTLKIRREKKKDKLILEIIKEQGTKDILDIFNKF